jgi:Carboxypeptidase regulatory-like domain/TonB-dependent Receptor Plug Domain
MSYESGIVHKLASRPNVSSSAIHAGARETNNETNRSSCLPVNRVALSSFLLLLCLLSVAPKIVLAQSTAGRLMGTVTDSTGSVVSGARVTITSKGTGEHQKAVSENNGNYAVFPVSPGTYDITVEQPGFRSVAIQNVIFDVNATIVRNFSLSIGGTSDQVTVNGSSAPLLNEDISVESVITAKQLNALPLNGRDFNQLVLLAAGATDNSVATGENLDFGSYSLNGSTPFANEYLIDGVTNDNPFQGTSAAGVSVDAIGQFAVISGVPPAEYGHAATAITMITRSGTRDFHGSLIEYYRGNALLANSPFDSFSGNESFLRNQFGVSFGGPVLLPHYDGRRHATYFFFNYEGARQTDTATQVDTVPLPAFWIGDFSSLLSHGIQLHDPFTSGRPAIPGNRLDIYKSGSLISSTALALHAYYPNPDLPGLASNLILFPSESSTADQFTVRLDQQLPKSEMLSFHYIYANTGGFRPNLLGNLGVGLSEPKDSRNGEITWTAPFGNNTVNELRLGGMNYSDIASYPNGSLPTLSTLGLQGVPVWPGTEVQALPTISFSGNDAFTSISDIPTPTTGAAALSMTANTFTVADTVSVTKGTHLFKAGFEGRRNYYNVLQQSSAHGTISFTGSSSSNNSSGFSFADFMIGLPSSSTQVAPKPKELLTNNEYAAFGEDTWRPWRNLTLDLGLRYELSPSPQEARNRLALFDPDIPGGGFVVACSHEQLPSDQFLPTVVSKLTDASGAFTVPIVCDSSVGYNARNLVSTGKNNWGPRAGVIWDPTGNGLYSLHVGYGIVYSRYPIQYFLQTALVNAPFAGTFPHSQSIKGGQAALTLTAPYGGSGKVTISPVGIQKSFPLQNNQEWNLTLERSIHTNNVVSLAYVGNKGTHLFNSFNANQPQVNPNTGALTLPYSGRFGTTSIPVRYSDANSIYNGMIVEFRRRVAQGLNLQANWTWAKAIDDESTNVQTANLDILDTKLDRGNSNYARRHAINVNGIYELPVGRGQKFVSSMPRWADAIAGGWMVSGIWHWTTGLFLTPSMTSEGGLANSRPNIVPGVSPNLPRNLRTRQHWFNAASFSVPPLLDPATGLPSFGNAPRNTIIGPGIDTVDLNMRKSFALGETRHLSVEADLFNALNHPNWGTPDTNISDTNTVGSITAVSKPMREAQFAARFEF